MRFYQVYIRHYGPIQKDLELNGAINVIRGPNESGKSLLVEGLLKQLDDGSVAKPVIDSSPEGFIELWDDRGGQKLDGDVTLSGFCKDRFNREIRPEDLRNVFVIQSGDLTFHEDDDFYTHITDKLTGRRVEDINEIEDALLDEGRLTGKRMNISTSSDYNDAGNQVGEARSLKQDVEEYIEKAHEEGLTRAEGEFLEAQRREDELETEIQKLERAEEEERKRDRYEELSKKKETIEENLGELRELPESSKLEEIDDRLKELSEEEGRQTELKEQKESNLTLAKLSIGAGLLAFGVLVASGFPAIAVIAPLLFIGAGIYFRNQAKSISDSIAELSVKEEEIQSDARAAGLSFDSRDEIRGKIADAEQERQSLEEENQGRKAVLERELEFDADSMEDAVRKAEERLETLEDEIDHSVIEETDAGELDEIKSEYEEVKKKRKRLDDELESHGEALEEFRTEAYKLDFSVFTGERLDLEIENLDALDQLVDRLEEFISAIEDDAEASRVAVEIFKHIQEEEKEETAELFEEGSRATEIFREITDDRYEKVTYDNEENQLKVVKSTGETFVPRELSDGTRDQLYLAIRVALGEEILDGESGFFIMDDAFLTSDPQRLEIQADLVEDLADQGWQIVYLSSKEDAISVLSDRSDNDVIELQALE